MVFGVGQFNYASHIWLGHALVAMATKICDFQHKIGYNSACAGDTPQMLAPTWGLSRSANLMVPVKLCSDDLCGSILGSGPHASGFVDIEYRRRHWRCGVEYSVTDGTGVGRLGRTE